LTLRFTLPILYVIVSAVSVIALGRVGRGRGTEVFYYASLPSGAVSLPVEKTLHSGEWAALSCFLAGLIQYFVVGYFFNLWVGRKRTGGGCPGVSAISQSYLTNSHDTSVLSNWSVIDNFVADGGKYLRFER
jgi:hypothetical protein